MVPCLSFGSVFDCTTDLYWKWSFISLSLVSFSRKYLFRHSIAALASTDVTGLLSTISISSSLLVSSFSAALMYGQPARMVNFCWTRPRTLQAGSTVLSFCTHMDPCAWSWWPWKQDWLKLCHNNFFYISMITAPLKMVSWFKYIYNLNFAIGL